LSATYCRQVDC